MQTAVMELTVLVTLNPSKTASETKGILVDTTSIITSLNDE
jgi:hypothetical protein